MDENASEVNFETYQTFIELRTVSRHLFLENSHFLVHDTNGLSIRKSLSSVTVGLGFCELIYMGPYEW